MLIPSNLKHHNYHNTLGRNSLHVDNYNGQNGIKWPKVHQIQEPQVME